MVYSYSILAILADFSPALGKVLRRGVRSGNDDDADDPRTMLQRTWTFNRARYRSLHAWLADCYV